MPSPVAPRTGGKPEPDFSPGQARLPRPTAPEESPLASRPVLSPAPRGGTQGARTGEFSIIDWAGYPSGLAKPTGPFRLLDDAEYAQARAAANKANAALRAANPASYAGKQIHEIHPVKFGGSPTDLANKVALAPAEHAQYTTFWNRLMRELQ